MFENQILYCEVNSNNSVITNSINNGTVYVCMYCSTDLKITHKNFTAHKIHNICFGNIDFFYIKTFTCWGMLLTDNDEIN
jgi:hypothetical protein